MPLFAFGKSKDATWATTPLGFFYKDEKRRGRRLCFTPTCAKDREDFGVFPLWFYSRRDTAHGLFILPFIYHSHDAARSRHLTVLGPLYFGRRGEATFGGFAPLFYGRNDGDGSYRFMALPLVYFSHRAGKGPRRLVDYAARRCESQSGWFPVLDWAAVCAEARSGDVGGAVPAVLLHPRRQSAHVDEHAASAVAPDSLAGA